MPTLLQSPSIIFIQPSLVLLSPSDSCIRNVLQPIAQYHFLKNLFRQVEDFTQLYLQYKPVMHVILTIWRCSRFFNTPARLAALVHGVCDDVIGQAQEYMRKDGLWTEPREVVRRLTLTIGQCVALKEAYLAYRARSQEECAGNPWRVQLSILFGRLDSFVERCHDVLDLMQTMAQFGSLENLEIGGTKGKTLTSSVHQIRIDFQQSIVGFTRSSQDIMDADCKEFESHFFSFRLRVQEVRFNPSPPLVVLVYT